MVITQLQDPEISKAHQDCYYAFIDYYAGSVFDS